MVQVWEDEDMPVDAEGNRADIIMDGDSILKRMNVGALYEQYVNATSRTVANKLRSWLGGPSQAMMNDHRDGRLDFNAQNDYMVATGLQAQKLNELRRGAHPELLKQCWEYLLGYYQIISPRQYEAALELDTVGQIDEIESVVTDFCRVWFPSDNPIYLPGAIEALRKAYPVHRGPVRYRGESRQWTTTVSDVLIGSVYFITLEKTGGDYSAVASARTQHIGILACLNKNDKHSSAVRGQAIRLGGESEFRAFAAFCGPRVVAELSDQANSPASHKRVGRAIMDAAIPSDIPVAIDRNELPLGGSRIVESINEAFFCGGIELYVPDGPDAVREIYPPAEVPSGEVDELEVQEESADDDVTVVVEEEDDSDDDEDTDSDD